MQVQQYVTDVDGIVQFSDNEARLLVKAGLVTQSQTIPARLDITTFVWDDLDLDHDKAIELLRQVAKAAAPEALTRKGSS